MGEGKLEMKGITIHPTAIVSEQAEIGEGTQVWAYAQVREWAKIGRHCIIGNGAYIDKGVKIGDRCNIHNKALLYRNLIVEEEVFIGPGVCFTNDPLPRSNRIRNLEGLEWRIRKGASVGANSTILPGVTVGQYAMVGAGSLVSRDVPDCGLVYGVPARLQGFVSPEGELMDRRDPVLLTARWLLDSGIQDLSGEADKRGGVHAWYEREGNFYPFLYSEITGYAMTTFVFLDRVFPNSVWMGRAELAAQWLIQNAFHEAGGVKSRDYLVERAFVESYAFTQGRLFAFDTAMVGYGLLQLYQRKGAEEGRIYLRYAERAADFLKRTLKKSDGRVYPYFDLKTGASGEEFDKWSNQTGSFHAKLALFLIDHYRLTGDPSSRELALKLLDYALSLQAQDGRFITSLKDESTELHPHCYTLEGLLYGALILKEDQYLPPIRKGMKWLLDSTAEDGSLPSVYRKGEFARFERSDVAAQVLRMGALLSGIGEAPAQTMAGTLKKIQQHLCACQFRQEDSQKGGFLYGYSVEGKPLRHLNSWCSMFALQALWMYEEFVEKKRPVTLENFI
ncbi:MAG: hypothetical protein HY391_06765 [Deltaproteobacteria bacterium]|nr:hypothetical protein [Deltaproteobacteria bacterium]